MISLWWAYPYTFFITLTCIIIACWYKYFHKNKTQVKHALGASYFKKNRTALFPLKTLRLLRIIALIALACLIARLQKVDQRVETAVDGIDFVLCMDFSGSMNLFDDLNDRRSRITVAKRNALDFIDQRTYDPVGIVVFGAEALTLCPLTLDKPLLKNFISNASINIVNPNGTKLFTGLATAISRLRSSSAKSKVVLLLTDGKPMGETRFDADTIIAMAQEFNVKIYSVGIGNKQGGYGLDVFGRIQPAGADTVDYGLLAALSRETGGKFFAAHNPKEMKEAYDAINKLEKTTLQTSMFSLYHELLYPFLWILIASIFLELLLRCFIWKGFFS
ncbi:VWA domain-containing protein [Candidatus Babeliales bacterium]|nr:VWA domain-containing protein [Candidatus Babeliales bacterium]